MRKVKIIALALLLAMAAGILSGCHGTMDSNAADAGSISEIPLYLDETKKIELTFWAKNDTNKVQTAVYTGAIEAFQKMYPNVTVNIRLYADYGRIFNDVITSAVVDWDGEGSRNAVTNELDVMCTRGITPVFISCKTCDVKTEALNELAILRDRFGGKIAKAAIVTAEKGGIPMRNRASELGISVIDLNDLLAGRTDKRLRSLMRGSR